MAEQFYTILTNTGKAKIANSLPTGQKVNLTKMKIGDSNGTYYNPSENQTELVHKVYECNVTSVEVDEINPSWITITAAIPSDVGGFSIREVGIFDDSNSLIAIGKYPETYKPVASDGSTKELYIKMTLEVTNAASVELKIDPTVILATKKDISNLDAKIEQNTSQLNENTQQHSFLDQLKLKFVYGIVGDGTDETEKLRNAINAEDSIYIPDNFNIGISSTIIISKSIRIYTNSGKLTCLTNGMDMFFSFQNTSRFIVQGVTFDDNLKGRTCIDVQNCTDFVIEKNKFTGYSAAFGYFQTDSAIRLTICQNAKVLSNLFSNFGNQYDTTTATLNRAITINDSSCINITIKDNIFNEVNQAIVNGSGKHILIEGNIFDGVHDNCIYNLGGYSISIIGNYIKNGHDESLVIAGNNIIISGNNIISTPNKAIAINGNINNLIISDNIIDNTDINSGQMIYFRDVAYTITNLTIEGNQFIEPTTGQGNYEFFLFGNVLNFKFKNNTLNLKLGSYQKILRFNGTSARGEIAGNSFIGATGSDSAGTALIVSMESTVTDCQMFYEDNEEVLCRAPINGLIIKNQTIRADIGPYVLNRSLNSIVYYAAIPTTGTWKVGDIVYNTAPNAGGYIGWICITAGTPGVWKGFGAIAA